MRTRTIIGLLALAAALLTAAPARAELEPPITVELVGDPNVVPIPGQLFGATLRFDCTEPVTMRHLELPGRWEAMSIGLAWEDSLELVPGMPQDVPFEIIGDDITRPLEVRVWAGGRKVVNSFFLVPPTYELNKAGGSGLQQFAEPGEHPFPVIRTDLLMADPVTDGPPGWEPDADFSDPEDQRVTDEKAAYALRVRGRFCYPRPDGPTVGVDNATVQVWDEDVNPDDLCAVGVTDNHGYFDFTFSWGQSEAPDIYVRVIMANSEVHCAWTGWDVNTWVWRTHTKDDFTGGDVNYGWFGPADHSERGVPNVLTIGTRAWRWSAVRGYDPPQTYIYIPSGDHAFYSSSIPAIKVGNPDFFWEEGVVSHEYGHHWAKTQSDYVFYDGIYCTGDCDPDPPDDCGHCMYSEETVHVAWTEGFPNWYSGAVVEQWPEMYNVTPFETPNYETNWSNVGGLDPNITEGFMTRMLHDVYDDNDDNDPLFPDGQDLMYMGSPVILEIAHVDRPVTPAMFHDDFLARYPGLKYEYWSTAKNNGYELDHAAPSAPTNLTSPSHDTMTSSSDGTIDYTWTTAADNMSGIDGYAIYVSVGAASPPGYTINVFDVSYTTPDLDPGFYYFNIRAVDRAGHWGGYATYGPIEIREPYPPDMEPFWALGWDAPVVPRNDTNAGPGNVHVPPVLISDTVFNYYNICLLNEGELATSTQWDIGFYVDGEYYLTETIPAAAAVPPHTGRAWYNQGVFYVDGGRHTYSIFIDMDESHAEMQEFTNRYGRQWIWEPEVVGPTEGAGHPPDPTGGLGLLFPGFSPNCDGYSIAGGTGYWAAGVLRAEDDADDYDCRMFPHSTGSENGFNTTDLEGLSQRPAGCLDAVLYHKTNAAGSEHDVGVFNWPRGEGGYYIGRQESATIAFGGPVTVDFAADQYLVLKQFVLGTLETGPTSIQLTVDPSAGPVHLGYLPRNYTTGGLDDLATTAVTDHEGVAVVEFSAPLEGVYGMVVWRDPSDIPAAKSGADKAAPALSMSVEVYPTPPDVAPVTAAGWYAPLVPRPADDGTSTAVPAPVTLAGDVPSTYLNTAFTNLGPRGAEDVLNAQHLDGEEIASQLWPSTAPAEIQTTNSRTPHIVRGGLHTLAMILDGEESLEETVETNNAFARQWVWSPTVLVPAVPVTRAAPPDPEAGWEYLPQVGAPLVMNCDGLGVPAPAIVGDDGWWIAVAVMPGDTSNVDLRLHDKHQGTQNGFQEIRAFSAWPVGESDFVMMNSHLTQGEAMDAGVVRTYGLQDYTAELVASEYLGRNPAGTAFTGHLEEGRFVDLYEVHLDPGEVTIKLLNQAGGADLGLTLHPPNVPYSFKANWVEDGESWQAGPGADEMIAVAVTQSGRYGLTVWKVGHADLPVTVQYELAFTAGLSGGSGDGNVPQRTRIASIAPNPFNPETSIAFELASAGPVTLEVFNIRGELVRRLVDGVAMPHGRHAETWDGRDAAGNRASSGLYVVRLRADGAEHHMKATLLK